MPKENKIKHLGARVTLEEYKLVKKTGYKPDEIFKMFINKYYNTTPVGLAIKLELLEKELEELPGREIAIKNEIK